jgi:hypothetical protein
MTQNPSSFLKSSSYSRRNNPSNLSTGSYLKTQNSNKAGNEYSDVTNNSADRPHLSAPSRDGLRPRIRGTTMYQGSRYNDDTSEEGLKGSLKMTSSQTNRDGNELVDHKIIIHEGTVEFIVR